MLGGARCRGAGIWRRAWDPTPRVRSVGYVTQETMRHLRFLNPEATEETQEGSASAPGSCLPKDLEPGPTVSSEHEQQTSASPSPARPCHGGPTAHRLVWVFWNSTPPQKPLAIVQGKWLLPSPSLPVSMRAPAVPSVPASLSHMILCLRSCQACLMPGPLGLLP